MKTPNFRKQADDLVKLYEFTLCMDEKSIENNEDFLSQIIIRFEKMYSQKYGRMPGMKNIILFLGFFNDQIEEVMKEIAESSNDDDRITSELDD